jgi:GTP-binding protein HflX
MPVNDRTPLILRFRATRSHGKLQVELARLLFLSTRLVRRWFALERQSRHWHARRSWRGGQIELDRRMIGESIKRTKELSS